MGIVNEFKKFWFENLKRREHLEDRGAGVSKMGNIPFKVEPATTECRIINEPATGKCIT
jgi:hypothetical protein